MKTIAASLEELDALERGRAFADLSAYRKVRVTGPDAREWLHSLVTTDVASLEPGRARRSLLLTPTGRIRADFSLGCEDEGFILLQEPTQPEHVGLILSPYTLSSDVLLRDATNDLALFAVPGKAARIVGRPGISPSVLGPGVDLLSTPGKQAWRVEDMFVKKNLTEAGPEALEIWRVRRGVPRMGADFDQSSLPAEAGLQEAIDAAKGCYLGQEAVAKIANLGHPTRTLRHVLADSELAVNMPVWAGSGPGGPALAGKVTSSAPAAEGWAAIVRVSWAAAHQKLTAGTGIALRAGEILD